MEVWPGKVYGKFWLTDRLLPPPLLAHLVDKVGTEHPPPHTHTHTRTIKIADKGVV